MISELTNRSMHQTLEYAKRIAYSSEETLMFTYEMAKKCKDLPGDYIECGVAAGAQVIAMSYGAPKKWVIAFDSFEGICLPSNRDDQMPGIAMLTKAEQLALPDPGKQALVSSGATVVSLEDFWDHITQALGHERNIIAVPGWFENTMRKDLPTKEIALLRLDGDLYNSTWVCLQHLFPKVVKGGCVIIDDIELKGCKDACDEYFKLIGYEPKYEYVSNIAYFYK